MSALRNITIRDYFAANAPEVPEWFLHKTGQRKKVIPDAERGGSWRKEQWYSWKESEEERLIRWNWHYADLMVSARKI